jgi:hypothetical protein
VRRPGPRARSSSLTPGRRACIKGRPSRFKRTDQDAGASALRLARHVQHERHAVCEPHIGVTSRQKHRGVVGAQAHKCMAGRIAERIGFCLDDPSADASFGEVAHEILTDHVAGQLNGIDRQIVTVQRHNGKQRRSHGGRSHGGTGLSSYPQRDFLRPWEVPLRWGAGRISTRWQCRAMTCSLPVWQTDPLCQSSSSLHTCAQNSFK